MASLEENSAQTSHGQALFSLTVRPIAETEMERLWELRGKVLRPGKPPETWRFAEDRDATTLHLGAFTPHQDLLGVLTLLENQGLQLRGMAVDAEARRRGVGSTLLEAAYAAAIERSFSSLWCNARAVAVEFYASGGWVVESDAFDVPGIGAHYVMRKYLPEAT